MAKRDEKKLEEQQEKFEQDAAAEQKVNEEKERVRMDDIAAAQFAQARQRNHVARIWGDYDSFSAMKEDFKKSGFSAEDLEQAVKEAEKNSEYVPADDLFDWRNDGDAVAKEARRGLAADMAVDMKALGSKIRAAVSIDKAQLDAKVAERRLYAGKNMSAQVGAFVSGLGDFVESRFDTIGRGVAAFRQARVDYIASGDSFLKKVVGVARTVGATVGTVAMSAASKLARGAGEFIKQQVDKHNLEEKIQAKRESVKETVADANFADKVRDMAQGLGEKFADKSVYQQAFEPNAVAEKSIEEIREARLNSEVVREADEILLEADLERQASSPSM